MDFFKELILHLGGAIGIAVAIVGFMKGLIQKWIENALDNAGEKNVAKYSNGLQRRTMAYEMLLQKEFEFYENAAKFSSELIVDIQDFTYYAGCNEDQADMYDYEKAKEIALKIISSIPQFKRDSLLCHNYIPTNIDEAATLLLRDLQDALPLMRQELALAINGKMDDAHRQGVRKIEEIVLKDCALLNLRIKSHLETISKS